MLLVGYHDFSLQIHGSNVLSRTHYHLLERVSLHVGTHHHGVHGSNLLGCGYNHPARDPAVAISHLGRRFVFNYCGVRKGRDEGTGKHVKGSGGGMI